MFHINCSLTDTTDLTKVFMQGYSAFIVDIQQLLFLAGENDTDKSWIEKMSASDPEEVVNLYLASYPTPSKAFSVMASEFGKAVDDFALTWDSLYENIKTVSDEYFTDDSCKEIDETALKQQVELAGEKANAQLDMIDF